MTWISIEDIAVGKRLNSSVSVALPFANYISLMIQSLANQTTQWINPLANQITPVISPLTNQTIDTIQSLANQITVTLQWSHSLPRAGAQSVDPWVRASQGWEVSNTHPTSA